MQRKVNGANVETGSQRRVLESLRLHGPKTARELSKLLGGGPVAMRAHLRTLLAARFVTQEEEHQPVGRPARRFQLTPDADALFTKQYDLFGQELMEAVRDELGEAALEKILTGWEEQLHGYLDAALPTDREGRLQALARHQSTFGFMASVERRPGESALVERNCPIAKVASRFPRICDHEAALFRRILGREVALTCCQARGDALCAFAIGKAPEATNLTHDNR